MIKTADRPVNSIRCMKVATLLALIAILLLMFGCSDVFNSEGNAVAELERRAVANQQFYRPNVQINYVFSDSPSVACRKAGLPAWRGDALACAVLGDPCIVILSWTPTRRQIREEQLHCVYGDWHVAK